MIDQKKASTLAKEGFDLPDHPSLGERVKQ